MPTYNLHFSYCFENLKSCNNLKTCRKYGAYLWHGRKQKNRKKLHLNNTWPDIIQAALKNKGLIRSRLQAEVEDSNGKNSLNRSWWTIGHGWKAIKRCHLLCQKDKVYEYGEEEKRGSLQHSFIVIRVFRWKYVTR